MHDLLTNCAATRRSLHQPVIHDGEEDRELRRTTELQGAEVKRRELEHLTDGFDDEAED